MGKKRIFMTTQVGIKPEHAKLFGTISNIPEFDISQLHIYENPPEPPSQQGKQTGDGEQVDDGRVTAG